MRPKSKVYWFVVWRMAGAVDIIDGLTLFVLGNGAKGRAPRYPEWVHSLGLRFRFKQLTFETKQREKNAWPF